MNFYQHSNVCGDELAETLADVLIGRQIVRINDDTLILDNDMEITIELNEGCGGCQNGWSRLDVDDFPKDNVITNVTFEQSNL